MNRIARHQARFYALQALYAWVLSGNSIHDIEAYFLANHDFKKTDVAYFQELLSGVTSHIDELDQYMLPYLDRPLEELNPIELCSLRMAIFELVYRKDIPFRVIINEAIELNKKFGSTDGFKYINGILDQVAKKLRTEENTDKT